MTLSARSRIRYVPFGIAVLSRFTNCQCGVGIDSVLNPVPSYRRAAREPASNRTLARIRALTFTSELRGWKSASKSEPSVRTCANTVPDFAAFWKAEHRALGDEAIVVALSVQYSRSYSG